MAITLKPGSQGDDVLSLQKKLIAKGHLATHAVDGTANADGKFGRITEQAVKVFQDQNGLEPDGIVGRATRAALGLELAAIPVAAASATHIFTDSQRLRLAEKIDALIPTGPFDWIDDGIVLWAVEALEAVLAAHLPKPLVDMLHSLSDGHPDLDTFKRRLTQLVNQNVNLPLFNEDTEQKIFAFVIDLIVDALHVGSRLQERLGA